MKIPRAVEEITADWLTDALRDSGYLDEGRIESVRVERTGTSTGFVGDVSRVTIGYSGGKASGPSSIVIKTASSDEDVRSFAVRRGFYERETRIMTDLYGETGIRTPRTYFGRFDPRVRRFVLAMEDLSHLSVGDEIHGHSLEDAETAVRALAGLHARWWDDPRLQSFRWLDRPLDNTSASIRALDYRAAWNLTADQLRRDLPPEVFDIGESLVHWLPTLWTGWTPMALTLNHGDYRFANLFFDEPGVIAFDWQYALVGPPAIDLADLLVWSLTEEQRRTTELDLVDLYVDELTRRGIQGVSRHNLVPEIRLGMLRNLENYVTSIPNLAMTDEAGRAWVDAMSPRMIALAEWDCGKLLDE